MSRARSTLGGSLALALTAAATTWVAMLSWRGFTADDAGFLVPLAAIGAVVAGIGAVGRWRRVPAPVVVVIQLLLAGAFTHALMTGTLLPGGELRTEVDAAVDAANLYAPPVPVVDGVSVHPLLIGGGLLAMLLVDLLACGLRRVPLAGLPLLTIYSVPVGLLENDLAWWVFAVSALGFLLMLYLQEQDQVGRWGRPLEDRPTPGAGARRTPRRRSAAVRGSAGAIALVATAMAVLVPAGIPTLNLQVFDLGSGPGGDGEIQIENPMVDLRRDLRQGDDLPLLRFRTDDPSPDHLRISVLNRFSDNEWSSGDRDVPTDQLPDGAMPPLEGVLESVARTEYRYDVTVAQAFGSTWLPTQAPISSITAAGDWRYDASTMDFIAGDDDELTTAGLSYQFTAVELGLTAEDLSAATGTNDALSAEVLDLPSGLPDIVRELATGVTAGADTQYAKAVALQNWFRRDGGFTYSLDRSPIGNGVDDLEAFLREEGRVGYCEQFAASMAVMARILDIPARVAVGFLEPRRISANEWEYSAQDLHAWPELYFAGAGWVQFEPTPGNRAPEVPSYTTQDVPVNNPSSPAAQPSAEPSAGPSTAPSAAPSAAPRTPEEAQGPNGADAGFPWRSLLVALALAALILVIPGVPRALRIRQRVGRLARGPESAWEELRAIAIDLGVAWPEDRSPRETQEHLVRFFGDPEIEDPFERPARGADQAPEAVAALGRIVAELERSRYARDHRVVAGQLHDEVIACSDALVAGVSSRVRRRAEWWPRSCWQRLPPATERTEDSDSYGRVVEHI